jgi:putative redox protein
MKTVPQLKDTVIKLEEQRPTIGNNIGTVRVDVKNVEQVRNEAILRGFSVTVDEPVERGGTNSGPGSLNYFVLGAASCFLTQMVKVSMIKNLKIDSMEITARAHTDTVKTRKFLDVIYDVRMTGDEAKEKLVDLLHEAEDRCFVHQTLKSSIPLTSNLSLNGTQIASHTLGPGTA